MEYLAKRIQEFRTENNYSQDELAQKIGVTRQAISKWERGEGLPDIYNIKKLAEVFEITVDKLIQEFEDTGTDSKPNNKLSLTLLSIPSFLILFSLPIVIIANLIVLGDSVANLFTTNKLLLLENKFLMYSFILLLLIGIVAKFTINLLQGIETNRNRIICIMLYGVVLILYSLLLLLYPISGFALIFLYLLGFLVIIAGIVGFIGYIPTTHIVISNRFDKFKKIVFKVILILLVLLSSLVVLNILKDTILLREVRYIDQYEMTSTGDNNLRIQISEQESGDFFFGMYIKEILTYNPVNPYMRIYLDGILISEGSLDFVLSESDVGETETTSYIYVYRHDVTIENYTLLIPDVNVEDLDNITYLITYSNSLGKVEVTKEVTGRTLDIGYNGKELWVWDYNKLVND